jgi:undecaprenyl-diphosphatase
MGIFEAVILGLIQGLTEFLPVSSSGHLVLLQQVMGLENVPIFFDTMLHFGTLIAVVVVLFSEIIQIFRHPVKNHLGMLILATIPAAAVGYLWSDYFESVFRSGSLLGICFLITAVIITVSELIASRINAQRQITIKSALSMGLMQAVAILPGVSRSGSTIAGGLFMGVDRVRAAKFSFLLSIPIILGSILSSGKTAAEAGLGDVSVVTIVVGTIVAAVAGFFAVKFMLAIIAKTKLYGFAVYVAALGAFLLLDQNFLHIIFK